MAVESGNKSLRTTFPWRKKVKALLRPAVPASRYKVVEMSGSRPEAKWRACFARLIVVKAGRLWRRQLSMETNLPEFSLSRFAIESTA